MLRTSPLRLSSHQARSRRLLLTASYGALMAAALVPAGAARAAAFTAGSETALRAAITAANASADASSGITLTGAITITDPALLPTATKPITIDAAGFTITDAVLKSSSLITIQGGGQLRLAGVSTVGGDVTQRAGTLRLDGGAKLNTGAITNVNAGGTLVVDGVGSVLTTDTFRLGADAGTATVRIQDGGVVRATSTSGSFVSWGNFTGAFVDITVTGAGSRLEVGQTIGIASTASADATVLIADGAAMTAPRINFGSPTTAQATPPSMVVDGAGSSVTVATTLGIYKGNFDVTGGGAVTTATLAIGGVNGTGSLLVSGTGSSVTSTGAITLGNGNTSNSTITLTDGGVLHANNSLTLGVAATRVGVINIGGTEGGAAAASGVLDAATATFGPGTGRLNFNHTDTNYSFAAQLTGLGAINQVAGVTHLTGTSSGFTGTTTVSGGALHVDGTLGGATSTVAVNGGGVLGGSGTIGGNVAVTNGVVAPGNSPGTLTIAGNLSLTAASLLDVEFGQSGVVGGPLNDLVKVGGALTLDGTVDVTVTAGGVFDAGLYRVINYAGALTDNGLTVGATPPGSTVIVQTAIPGQVNLVNTGGLTLNFWDGGDVVGDSVLDGGNGAWTSGGVNWTTETGAVNSAYTTDSLVIFAAAPGTVTVGAVNPGSLQFAVDGYRLTGGAITLDSGGHIFRVGDGTADGKTYVATIDTPVVGAGATLTKTDLGTLILNGANTYTGVTTIQAGTLLLNGSVAGGGSAVIVDANGTFGGTGTSPGAAVSGTLAPGGLASPGALTLNNNLTLNPTATLRYRLGQADTPGGALNDLLVINGNLTLDGTLNVTQSAGGTFGNGIYRLIDYSGVLTDNILAVGSLPGGSGTIQTAVANQINLVVTGVGSGGGGGGGGGGGDGGNPPPPPPFTFWDAGGTGADGAISGGTGTWRAAGGGGWTDASGATNGAFANGDFAIFTGQAGVVTIDNSQGAVSVDGLQFAADGYRVTGGALTLAGTDVTIRVGDGTTAGAAFTAVVDAELAGSARLVKTDAGALILAGANSYTGGTTIAGGVLVGSAGSFGQGAILDNAALVIDQAMDAALANAIDGTGSFAKRGAGRLIYSGQGALTGATTVEAGLLQVDGSLGASRVSVRGGAALTGTGTVGGVDALSGSLIAPGNGIGTLTLNGPLTQAAGSVLQIQIDPAAGTSDQLVVNGAASLADGAVLDVVRVGSARYEVGKAYAVVRTTGGLSGTYRLSGDVDLVSAFLGLRDSYDANNAYLTVAQVRPLTDAGLTPNQVATGAGADSLPMTNPVRETLVYLPTDAVAQAAFDQLSGEANVSAKAVFVAQSGMVRDAALARLDDVGCGQDGHDRNAGCPDGSDRAAGWAQVLGGWGHLGGRGGAVGVDHDTSGFLTGLDLPVGDWRLGALAGYSRSNWDVDARGASGDSDDYHLGAYAGRAEGRLNLRLGAAYTWHDVSARRSVAFADIAEGLKADYDAGALQAFGEVGYRLDAATASWEPFVGLAHVRLRADGFTETGGQTALSAAKDTLRTTVATVGVRPTMQVAFGSTRVALKGMVGWRHTFGDRLPTSTHAFSGGEAFAVRGAALARDAAAIEAGADFAIGQRGVASLSYGGQFGDEASEQRVRLDLRMSF